MPENHKWLVRGLREGFEPRDQEVMRNPLPERWVDLIQYLNAQEREREERGRKKRRPDAPF